MDLVDGVSLRHFVDSKFDEENNKIGISEHNCKDLILQLLDGISYLH